MRKPVILLIWALWGSGILLFTFCSEEKDNYRSVTDNLDPASIEQATFKAYFPLESSIYVITKGKGIDSSLVVTVGTAKYDKGVRGYAYLGDTTQSQQPESSYIKMPLNANNLFKDLKEFTLSCWLKCPKSQSFQEAIVLVDGGDSISGTLSLTLDQNSIKGNVFNSVTDSTYSVSVSKTNITEDKWVFTTFTYDQTTSKLALFVDGKLLNETLCLDILSAPMGVLALSPAMTQLYIGAFPLLMKGTATADMAYFSGSIDEMRMWSKCLTTEEISSLYSAESNLAKLP